MEKLTYNDWLHEVTILGYEEEPTIVIAVEDDYILKTYYDRGNTSEEAIQWYSAFLEVKNDPWFAERPENIKKAIIALPPTIKYRFKDSKKECVLIAYQGPTETQPEVTVTVQKTGEGGALSDLGLGAIDTNKVFGVKLTDLEPVTT